MIRFEGFGGCRNKLFKALLHKNSMSNVDKHGFCGGKYFDHAFPTCFSGNMSNFGSALILPCCAMTQYHQNPAAPPQADTRLANQSGNFGAAI